MSILETAKSNFKNDKDAWSKIYEKAKDDLHFISDDPYAQWDQKDYDSRVKTGRPALTIDQLGQFVHQVANDIRMNTPSINVIPSDVEASEPIAEIFKGLIREIEYHSNADDVYDTASLNAIRCSLGWIRVDFDYDGKGFDQRLVIKRVFNPLSVWIDFESVECDGRDAKRATVIDRLTIDDFKKLYPGKTPSCFEDPEKEQDLRDGGELISIAEYFEIEERAETITSEDGEQTREVINKTVKRYILSGQDVLEESTFPGKYIPIVPVYGEEAWIDGKRQVYSLIRKAKQAQQMFNYWKSLETELLMKAPQAPVMAAEGQVEDYANDWKNPSKSMVLRYKTRDANGEPVGMPQRLEPPTIPTGVVNAARQTVDDIKATMGIYNAGLGMISNETSGIAIKRRQQEGDVATYHFQDNLVRSITQLGRILVCAIPEVYSNQRIIRILGMEDEPRNIGINGALAEDQPETIDLSQGEYEVRVKTGGSFTTKREEAAEFLSGLINVSPEMMSIMGDLMFENLDFAGAPVMAERMKKIIDPKFLDEDTDPQVMALNQALQEQQVVVQELQGALAQSQQELQSKQAELMIKGQELQIKQAELQAKALDTQADNQLEVIKEQNKVALEQARLELDKYKADIELSKAQTQNDKVETDNALNVMEALTNRMQEIAQANESRAAEIIGAIQVQGANEKRTADIMSAINAPKRVVRDGRGDIIGVEVADDMQG